MADNFRLDPSSEDQWAFDPYAHAVTVISEPHRLNHDGFVHHATYKAVGLIDEAVLTIHIKTGAGYAHLNRQRTSVGAGDVDIDIREDATCSADGTAIPSSNTNRNSTTVPTLLLFHTPTVSDSGDSIHSLWVPPTATGIGQTADGESGATEGEEWLLKPSTSYLKTITNESGSTISVWLEFLWYEIGYTV